MPNPRLATRYAKSLIDLSIEKGQLEQVYLDTLYLKGILQGSKELINFLNNPVIHSDEKLKVIQSLRSGQTTEITQTFNNLLVKKGREGYLPEIIEAFITQYKEHKGILTVILTTAIPVSDEVKNTIINRIKREGDMREVELISVVQENIIGGFILEGNGRRIDASVAYDLTKVKNRFLTNEFIYRFR
ncbi:MAG TPA: ATP synthase F1 subunit delta [Puia sp.]|jgi:F-type H+-transporting ATPase subunit delta